MAEPRRITALLAAGPERDDARALRALREQAPELASLSRALLKRWLSDGTARLVRIAGQAAVEVTLPQAQAVPRVAVLYESPELLILSKPDSVASAPIRPGEGGTAVDAALARAPCIAQVAGLSPREPGLLHRLDTRTSGCLAFAKTPTEFARLRQAWRSGAVAKHYRAVVHAGSAQAQGIPASLSLGSSPFLIDLPLAHDPKSDKRMVALTDAADARFRGKPLPARTWIRAAHGLGGDRWDLSISIETGVMHQIRCHLASIGLPVEGDVVYGPAAAAGAAPRMGLHAWRLELPLSSGVRLSVESLVPWDAT